MDTTERLNFHFSLSCIGEGNGNPLQYSCLENPRDGGAWWAAIYGVAQSRTRLKRLSSSSSSSSSSIEFLLRKQQSKTLRPAPVAGFSLTHLAGHCTPPSCSPPHWAYRCSSCPHVYSLRLRLYPSDKVLKDLWAMSIQVVQRVSITCNKENTRLRPLCYSFATWSWEWFC